MSNLPLVIALVAQNENQALRAASDDLGRAFASSHRHCIVDLGSEGGTRELLSYLKKDTVAFVYGFAGIGGQLHLDDGTNLWTAAKVPFAALWYDHPCYHYRQHIVDSPFVFHCYHVKDYFEAKQKYLPSTDSHNVLLPPPHELIYAARIPYPMGGRPYPLTFAKTAHSPTEWIKDWRRHSQPLQDVLHALAERAIKNRNLDLADEAKKHFEQHNLDFSNLDLFMGAVQEVDHYVRAWRSDRLARALLPHPARIIGRGWEYLHSEPHQAVFLPAMSTPECWDMLWKSKIVANTNPLWRDGIHERVWGGAIAGTLTLTDRSVKSDAMLGGLLHYRGFEWEDNLEDVVADALRKSQEDDKDYFLYANSVLKNCGYTPLNTYARLLEEQATKIRELNTQRN